MGIFCEINLCTPADGKYVYQPGSVLSGAIRYCPDKEYVFSSITVSLKGIGKLYFEDLTEKRRDRMYQYNNREVYVDFNDVIHTGKAEEPLPAGQYDSKFSFQLPHYIPASLDYTKSTVDYYVRCNIQYYVRIKFQRPGRFNLNKHYKKEIKVISGQMPRMTTQPLTYGDQKKILQLSSFLSSKKGLVRLKATIANSVLTPGERVKVDYEIENSTNIEIKRVQVQMLEVDKYTSTGGRAVKVYSRVDGAAFTHEAVKSGETAKFTTEITVPEICSSIDHSKIISRDYCILTTVVLPMPHINLPLEIPFQVISRLSSIFEETSVNSSPMVEYPVDAPPTYWEAMGSWDEDLHDDKEAASSLAKEEAKIMRFGELLSLNEEKTLVYVPEPSGK